MGRAAGFSQRGPRRHRSHPPRRPGSRRGFGFLRSAAMKPSHLVIVVLCLVIAACSSAPPASMDRSPVKVARMIPYQEGAANEAIQRECDFSTYLPERIAEVGAKKGIAVQ